jgi:hypothetical protein
LGSGFPARENGTVVDVTCDHVIKGADAFLKAPDAVKALYLGLDASSNYVRLACKVIYRNPSNDIAIVQPFGDPKLVGTITSKALETNMFAPGSGIVQGRGILMIGYPLDWRTTKTIQSYASA